MRHIWLKFRSTVSMTPLFAEALATPRADLQSLTAVSHRIALDAFGDDSRTEQWIHDAVTPVWRCQCKGPFATLLMSCCTAGQIQCVESSQPDIAFYDSSGIQLTQPDKALLFLLLLFWSETKLHHTDTAVPIDTPTPITKAIRSLRDALASHRPGPALPALQCDQG